MDLMSCTGRRTASISGRSATSPPGSLTNSQRNSAPRCDPRPRPHDWSLLPAGFTYVAIVRAFRGRQAVHVHSDQHDRLCRVAAAKNRAGAGAESTSRNLVGSISVSLANTELVQRWQFHQSRLAENLTQSSLSFQSAVHNLTQYFGQFGSPAGAQGRPFGYIRHLIADPPALMDYTQL